MSRIEAPAETTDTTAESTHVDSSDAAELAQEAQPEEAQSEVPQPEETEPEEAEPKEGLVDILLRGPASVLDGLDAWLADMAELADDVSKLRRSLSQLERKGLSKVSGEALKDVSTSLNRLRLKRSDAASIASELATALKEEAERREAERREGLLQELRDEAEKAKLAWTRLAEDPLEVRIGPFDVLLEEGAKAKIRFGRDTLDEAPVIAERIVSRCGELVEKVRKERIAADEFLDQLIRAWRMVLAAAPSDDERVDIVDTLYPLGLLHAGQKQWRRSRKVEPMERWRLVYQLYRLQKEGRMEHRGLRLEMSAATIASTRDARNVVFVPRGDGSGQYYGSMRFIRVRSLGSGDENVAEPSAPATEATLVSDTAEQTDLDALLDTLPSKDTHAQGGDQ